MRPARRRSRGQAAVEYLLVAAAVALAFGLGADAPLLRLLAALADRHARFTWEISLP